MPEPIAPASTEAPDEIDSVKRLFLLALALLTVSACATRSASNGEMAAVAPMLSVERFLQAANARDLDAMARLFGTADGPAAETGGAVGCAFRKMGSWIGLADPCPTSQDVELRMDAIAQILEHQDYRVASESRVAGRRNPTRRVGVDLVIRGDTVSDVPFVVVQTGGDRWMIEQIGLERITQR